jgi:hypothetical protein
MSKARRHFLQGAATVAVVALAVPLRILGAAAPTTAATSDDVNYDSFSPLIASDFVVLQNGAAAATLRLVNIERLSSLQGYRDPVQAALNSFTLILRSEQPSALKEGIYTFSNPRLAPFSAFISPINGDHRTYQIVYNRNSG